MSFLTAASPAAIAAFAWLLLNPNQVFDGAAKTLQVAPA
jgi:hypothetical protein